MFNRRFSNSSSSSLSHQYAPPPLSGANVSRSQSTASTYTHRPIQNLFGDLSPAAAIGNGDVLPPPPYQIQSPPEPAAGTRRVSMPAQVQAVPAAAPGGEARRAATTVNRRNSVEDRLATLSRYDIVLLVDDSPSMVDFWDETRDALMGLVQTAVRYDRDGIDVHWLNAEEASMENVTSAQTIMELFQSVQPSGSTPTSNRLDDILRPYVEEVEDAKSTRTKVKPKIVLVLTDGRADDTDGLKEVIVEMAGRLDEVRAPRDQCGISFIQVGDDEDAARFLQELDDDLKEEHSVRDMVDTIPYKQRLTAEFLEKAMLGSVSRRLDNQAAA